LVGGIATHLRGDAGEDPVRTGRRHRRRGDYPLDGTCRHGAGSRLRVASAAAREVVPTPRTGTEPVSEFDDGVPARPTPAPRKQSGSATFQYAMPSFQRRSISTHATRKSAWPIKSFRREPFACTSFAERGATRTMQTTAGRIAAPASIVE